MGNLEEEHEKQAFIKRLKLASFCLLFGFYLLAIIYILTHVKPLK